VPQAVSHPECRKADPYPSRHPRSGDARASNTLTGDDGHCRGQVDLGELRVADRWADLAVATLSLGWNHPDRRLGADVFAAWGVEPKSARIDY
jgi:kanamycin kinase